MTSALITHDSGAGHVAGPHHPERPERLIAVANALATPEFTGLVRLSASEASDEDLERVHPRAYVEALREASPLDGYVRLDADTAMSPGTLSASSLT